MILEWKQGNSVRWFERKQEDSDMWSKSKKENYKIKQIFPIWIFNLVDLKQTTFFLISWSWWAKFKRNFADNLLDSLAKHRSASIKKPTPLQPVADTEECRSNQLSWKVYTSKMNQTWGKEFISFIFFFSFFLEQDNIYFLIAKCIYLLMGGVVHMSRYEVVSRWLYP